jgi:NADPH:quinone reductase
VLRVEERPDPEPGPGQVAVAVEAAGVNFVDGLFVAGQYQMKPALPFVPGSEVAGHVVAVGPDVQGVSIGDRVLASVGLGGFASRVVVAAQSAIALPEGLDAARAATFTQSYSTSLYALRERAGAAAGESVLVLGAGGGVGLFLLQLAAQRGIQVTAAGRPAMHQQMRALGAANCVDYTSEDLTRRTLELAGGPVDAVADLVGGRALAEATGALRPGGQAAAIATPELDLDPLLDANITFHGILIQDDGQRTREIAALLASGNLHPVIAHQLPLAQAARAHRILQGQHPGGKIVLTLPH